MPSATVERKADPEIQLSNLTKSYREGDRLHEVIRNLTASFAAGETVALRGRSGSGKSTLLNLISGIDLPDAGRVTIAGRNLSGMSETARTLFRRAHVGFVYQAFNLVPTLSVSDNIRLVLELNDVKGACAQERIRYLLDAVALADRADSYPDILSGGEQQRVAIARALAHEPRVLLADEPTGNLDDRTADSIMALLDRLVRQEGRTMIIATHSQGVAGSADRVLELQAGGLAG
jgi:putative ABC transport system ATP-binding protein